MFAMRWARRAAAATLLLTAPLSAQLARGTVRQSATGVPITGALVELLAADSAQGSETRVASTLSDADGAFTLRAPAPGRYRLGAKRIGVRRYLSDPFTLASGETRAFAIQLEALEYRLPEIVVSAYPLCSAEPSERVRVASLWEEARTALDAAEISLRDRLFTAQVTRYARELEPRTLRVVQESRSDVRGLVGSPITTLPPESLSIGGYWRTTERGTTLYYVPDPAALLSDGFQEDHCFRPVTGRGARQGLVGLAFAPSASRNVPDVRGTFWLDAKNFDLRLVEFSYVRLPAGIDSSLVGGEVHFARLANGAWIVRQWFLRSPVSGRPAQPVATEGSAPWVLVRPAATSVGEEGAIVTTDELRSPVRPATVTGVVRDSTGRGFLPRALVRLGGSTRSVTPDGSGRFSMDALTPGPVTLVLLSEGYDSLGVAAAEMSMELAEGDNRRVTLSARDARATTMRLCKGDAAPFGRGTVRVALHDAVSGAPRTNVDATLRWTSVGAGGDSVATMAEARSDSAGFLTFCAVPADRTLSLDVGQASEALSTTLTIRAREVRRVDVRLGGPARPNE